MFAPYNRQLCHMMPTCLLTGSRNVSTLPDPGIEIRKPDKLYRHFHPHKRGMERKQNWVCAEPINCGPNDPRPQRKLLEAPEFSSKSYLSLHVDLVGRQFHWTYIISYRLHFLMVSDVFQFTKVILKLLFVFFLSPSPSLPHLSLSLCISPSLFFFFFA